MPLRDAIEAHVHAAKRIHVDDTMVPVLVKGQCRTNRLLWAHVPAQALRVGAPRPLSTLAARPACSCCSRLPGQPSGGQPALFQDLPGYAGSECPCILKVLVAENGGGLSSALGSSGRRELEPSHQISEAEP